MYVLQHLRFQRTGKYLQGAGQYPVNLDRARIFDTIAAVLQYAGLHGLQDTYDIVAVHQNGIALINTIHLTLQQKLTAQIKLEPSLQPSEEQLELNAHLARTMQFFH